MQPVQTVIQLAQHLSTVILAVCASAVTVTKWFNSRELPVDELACSKAVFIKCCPLNFGAQKSAWRP